MSFYNLDVIARVLEAKTPEEIPLETKTEVLRKAKALFVHPGEDYPDVPHPILSSGKCSNGYFNLMMLYLRPLLLEAIMNQIGSQMQEELGLGNEEKEIYVCGPALGAIVPGFLLAKKLGTTFYPIFAEKDKFRPNAMNFERFSVPSTNPIKIIFVEDATTTSETILRTYDSLGSGREIEVLGVALIVDRRTPEHKLPKNWKVFSWADYRHNGFETYNPLECPLCKFGSKPMPPKSNWDQFFSLE